MSSYSNTDSEISICSDSPLGLTCTLQKRLELFCLQSVYSTALLWWKVGSSQWQEKQRIYSSQAKAMSKRSELPKFMTKSNHSLIVDSLNEQSQSSEDTQLWTDYVEMPFGSKIQHNSAIFTCFTTFCKSINDSSHPPHLTVEHSPEHNFLVYKNYFFHSYCWMSLKGCYDCKMTIPDPGPETTMSNARTARENHWNGHGYRWRRKHTECSLLE